MMKRLPAALVAGALAVMGLGACGSSGGDSRTIQVDYHSDDFAGTFRAFFPREVTVRPGMTLKFHQTWTGEPHTVTFGTMIDKGVKPLLPLLDGIAAGTREAPDEPPPEYDPNFWEKRLPAFFGEAGISQAAAQPCFVKTETELPLNQKPCQKSAQVQPAFDGSYAYYSSGFIPFEGQRGNTYEVKIAPDAKEGTYFYYCNLHDVPMSGKITVRRGAHVESQVALNRRGKQEADRIAKPLLVAYDKEKAGQAKFKGNLAGSGDDSTRNAEGSVNEFTPRVITTKVGEKVTWTLTGEHTISFNVPRYSPLFTFDKKGNLAFNEKLSHEVGGWPGPPRGHDEFDGPPPPLLHLDAGAFDGSGGLKSSGSSFNPGDTYSVTFTKAGTYPYACLIHPGMIGKVVVS